MSAYIVGFRTEGFLNLGGRNSDGYNAKKFRAQALQIYL